MKIFGRISLLTRLIYINLTIFWKQQTDRKVIDFALKFREKNPPQSAIALQGIYKKGRISI